MIARKRSVAAGLILTIGLLQAWDSHALAAGTVVALLAVAAVAIPAAAALVANHAATCWAAIGATAVLAFGARLVSPTPLPELGLLVLIAAIGLHGATPWNDRQLTAGC
jgi:hypothetical protein